MTATAVLLIGWSQMAWAEVAARARLQEWGFGPPLSGSLSIAPDMVVKYNRGETYFTKPIKVGELCSFLVLQTRKALSDDLTDLEELAPQISTHYEQISKDGVCAQPTPDAPGLQASSLLQAIGGFKEALELDEKIKGKRLDFKFECGDPSLCPGGQPGPELIRLINSAFLDYDSFSPLLIGHDTDQMVFVASDESGFVTAIYVEAHRTFPDPTNKFRGRLTELYVSRISLP